MEVPTNKKDYPDLIYDTVNTVNAKNNYCLYNSVVIAQSVLETGWGQSEIMMKANALFGIKATSSWTGKVFSSSTKEIYDSVEVTTQATFRAYDSIEDSVEDYFNLIMNSSRYSGALNASSQETCVQAIKDGGYATDTSYVSKVMSIINSNDFISKYDTNTSSSSSTSSTSDIQVGDKVKVLNAVQYTGESFKVYYDEYDVIQVNGDRVVIGIGTIVTCAINISNIEKVGSSNSSSSSTSSTSDIQVGDKVKVLNAVQYTGESFKVYYDEYDVIQVNGDRVVIGIGTTVTCAINISNIEKVS